MLCLHNIQFSWPAHHCAPSTVRRLCRSLKTSKTFWARVQSCWIALKSVCCIFTDCNFRGKDNTGMPLPKGAIRGGDGGLCSSPVRSIGCCQQHFMLIFISTANVAGSPAGQFVWKVNLKLGYPRQLCPCPPATPTHRPLAICHRKRPKSVPMGKLNFGFVPRHIVCSAEKDYKNILNVYMFEGNSLFYVFRWKSQFEFFYIYFINIISLWYLLRINYYSGYIFDKSFKKNLTRYFLRIQSLGIRTIWTVQVRKSQLSVLDYEIAGTQSFIPMAWYSTNHLRWVWVLERYVCRY